MPVQQQRQSTSPSSNRGSRYKAKTQSDTSSTTQDKPRLVPVKVYRCTVCKNPVNKSRSCGETGGKSSGKGSPTQSSSGLGKFKCSCGNKTVTASLAKSETKSEAA